MSTPESLPTRTSLVQVRIGGRTYDARRAPGCHVCQHPARMDIERMLVDGHPYQRIATAFSNVEYQVGTQTKVLPVIGFKSIRQHYLSNHMPVDAKAVRDIVEQRLEELGKHAEDLEERFVDSYAATRIVLAKGVERIAREEIIPSVRETLAAAKLLEEFKLNETVTADSDAWQEAMTIYFQQAQEIMPAEMWDKFVRGLSVNPQLRALAARLEPGASQGEEVIEAEIINSTEDIT
jgi:hypothetical protein